jgi:hypothetical protein
VLDECIGLFVTETPDFIPWRVIVSSTRLQPLAIWLTAVSVLVPDQRLDRPFCRGASKYRRVLQTGLAYNRAGHGGGDHDDV